MKTKNIFTVLTLCCLLCLLKPGIIYAQTITHGTVQNISFFSPSLGEERNLQVYLPYDYNQGDTITRYPVIYFLHGAGNNQTSYPYLIQILDTLISDDIINPVIVVKPDGRVPPFGSSFYTNSILYGNFEDYIVYDLVSYIDSAFNTDADRAERGIMGHSMGGFGAMKLALKHPDIYCAVAAHSGPLDFTHYIDAVDSVLAEYPGGPPYQYDPNAGNFSYFAFCEAGAFSPNLENPPYLVDFPLDSLGNPIDSTIYKWLLHSPAHLANYVSPDSVPSIYFDCGMEDNFTLFGWNTGFRDTLDELGLPYTFVPFHGNHWDHLINRLRVSLTFLDSVMPPTPVELVSFSGNIVDRDIFLSWTTATETNNQGFEIQRSNNGNDFTSIGFIGGNGTTTTEHNYGYTDKNLHIGKYYYRLKQMDFNGSYEYSSVVEVTVNVPIDYSLQQNYPNPFNPSTTIKYSIPEKSNVTLKIYDILGSEVEVLFNGEKPAGSYELTWNAANHPSGVYFYKMQAGSFVETMKMILLK